jgi:hypothetical protein
VRQLALTSRLDGTIGQADALEHLGALDVAGIIEAHRRAIAATEELDQVTQDMPIGQSSQLDEFHWFVRAHWKRPTDPSPPETPVPRRPRPSAPRSTTFRPGLRPEGMALRAVRLTVRDESDTLSAWLMTSQRGMRGC